MPRPARLALKITLVLAALMIARIGTGLIGGWWHYSHTPDFATYVAEHPVAEARTSRELAPDEPVLSPTDSFVVGAVDPALLTPREGEHEQSTRDIEIELWHGEECLLRYRQKIHLALARTDWSRHGLRLESPEITTRDGMRAHVDARIWGLDEMFATEPSDAGVVLDVVLVAGDGESSARIHRGRRDLGGADPSALQLRQLPGNPLDSYPWWCFVLGIAHHTGGLPDDGLIHRLRLAIPFDERRVGNGESGPTLHPPEHAVNTQEYSYRLTIKQTQKFDGSERMTSSVSWERKWSWNGDLW